MTKRRSQKSPAAKPAAPARRQIILTEGEPPRTVGDWSIQELVAVGEQLKQWAMTIVVPATAQNGSDPDA